MMGDLLDGISALESFDLKGEREKAALSQRQMAERLHVAQSAVSRMEQNPNSISLADLKKWAEALGYLPAFPGVNAGAPYEEITQALKRAASKLSQWEGDVLPDVPVPGEVAQSLRKIATKPLGVVAGRSDAGKSRLINYLLGKNVLLATYGPSTRLFCILRHVEDRPPYLDASVYVLRDLDRFDFSSPLLDESLRIESGGFELIKKYGGGDDRSYREAEHDARFLLIFVDSPILKTCDLVDTPGFSHSTNDVRTTIQALQKSHFLIHCSPAMDYMGAEDLILLQEAVKHLGDDIPRIDESPFGNVLLLATMAFPDIQDADLQGSIAKGVFRLARHLTIAVPEQINRLLRAAGNDTTQNIEDVVRTALALRAFPLFVDLPARRERATDAFRQLVGSTLPPVVEQSIDMRVHDLLEGAISCLDMKATEVNASLSDPSLISEHLESYPERQKLIQGLIRQINVLIDKSSEECTANAKPIAEFYYDARNIDDIIRNRYGKDSAKLGIVPFVMENISNEIAEQSRSSRESLSEKLVELFAMYKICDTRMRANVLSNSGVASSSELISGLFTVLSSELLKISVANAERIEMLRFSGPEKLAREVSVLLRETNLYRIIVEACAAYWADVRQGVESATSTLGKVDGRRHQYLVELRNGGGAKYIKCVDELGSLFRKARWSATLSGRMSLA